MGEGMGGRDGGKGWGEGMREEHTLSGILLLFFAATMDESG